MFRPTGHSRMTPQRFGRRPAYAVALAADRSRGVTLADDVKLLAMSFVGGLVFMSVYLG